MAEQPPYPPLKIDLTVQKEIEIGRVLSAQGPIPVPRPFPPRPPKGVTIPGRILSAQGMAPHEIEARKQLKRDAGIENPRDRLEEMGRDFEERKRHRRRLASARSRKWRARQKALVEQFAPPGFIQRKPLMLTPAEIEARDTRRREARERWRLKAVGDPIEQARRKEVSRQASQAWYARQKRRAKPATWEKRREANRQAQARWQAKAKGDPVLQAQRKASARRAQQAWRARQPVEADPVTLAERRENARRARQRWHAKQKAEADPVKQTQRRAANRAAQARWQAKAEGDPALQAQRRASRQDAQARYRARKKAGTVQET